MTIKKRVLPASIKLTKTNSTPEILTKPENNPQFALNGLPATPSICNYFLGEMNTSVRFIRANFLYAHIYLSDL